jgi:hypothetical protein
MASIFTQGIGSIFDHYSRAIEGDQSGSYPTLLGIPSVRGFEAVEDVTLTAIAGTGFDVIVTTLSSVPDVLTNYAIRADSPPIFAKVATSSTAVVGSARRLESTAIYQVASRLFYVLPTWSQGSTAPSTGTTFTIHRGFKRAPDTVDLEAESASGFDRFFEWRADSGKRAPWYGNGVQQHETTARLRVRYEKRARRRTVIAAAMENALMLRTVLSRGDMRDGSYVQILDPMPDGPAVAVETEQMLIVEDRFRLVYRVDSTFP